MTKSSPVSGASGTELYPITPCRPPAAWAGGKRRLAPLLAKRIAAIPHDTYAEVFVGMGGLFFRRELRPRSEVINDWSDDVATFFRVLQHHYVAFMDMLRFQITSRAGFEKLLALEPSSLTDLQRSARFLYLQRLAFGGKVDGRSFGISPVNPARFDVTKLGPILEAVHERLSGVVIEHLPWAKFIDRYDRPGTLFYLDPPYWNSEDDYGKGLFSQGDFTAIASRLATLKGRFLLSINDRPEVRELFSRFSIEPVMTRYSLAGNGRAIDAPELVISG